MSAPFDHIAQRYDARFTNGAIGRLQRQQVWHHIERIIPGLSGLEILELNCGTGEDAILFGEKGFNIVATDVSLEMLKVTQQKAQQFSMQHRISSQYLDLESFDASMFDKKFDLIFSNFGGLNCVNPESLAALLKKIPLLLSPGGRFIAVVMPRFCLWESIYFLLTLRFGKIFRRWTSGEVTADLHGSELKIWYYKPSQLKGISEDNFTVIDTYPIGFALPPSYLDSFFEPRKKLLNLFSGLEKMLSRISLLSAMSDHYLIDLKLK